MGWENPASLSPLAARRAPALFTVISLPRSRNIMQMIVMVIFNRSPATGTMTKCRHGRYYGWIFSPFANIAMNFSMRAARVCCFFAVWILNRKAYRLLLSNVLKTPLACSFVSNSR